MPICSLDDRSVLFASTSVSNLFIQDYLVRAPGDYVRVYLYGLMQSQYPAAGENTLEKFALSLRMDGEDVLKAFEYWQSKGLILRGSDGGWQYLDARAVLLEGRATGGGRQQDAALSNIIAGALGERTLTKAQTELLYDLKEVFGFEDETVGLFAQYCVNNYSAKKLTRERMETLCQEWVRRGITSPDKARDYILGKELASSPANEILTLMGQSYRKVTAAEHSLFLKWRNQWGFSLEAVKAACSQMSGVSNPNFKYLDKVIDSLRRRGLNTPHRIEQGYQVKEEIDKKIQECSYRLGVRGIVTQEQRSCYRRWSEQYGLGHEAILAACDEACAAGRGSYKEAESIIASYVRRGIAQGSEVAKDRRMDELVQRVYGQMGLRRGVTLKDKELIAGYLPQMGEEVILLAAGYSADARSPMAMLGMILKQWQQKGIRSAEAARKEHESRPSGGPRAGTARDYQQHTYENGELDNLFDDPTERKQ
jgi:hypothetical protein